MTLHLMFLKIIMPIPEKMTLHLMFLRIIMPIPEKMTLHLMFLRIIMPIPEPGRVCQSNELVFKSKRNLMLFETSV